MLQAQSNGPRVSVSVVIVDFPDYCGPRLFFAKLDKALLTKGAHRQITAFFVCPNALFHASPAVGRRFAC
jgi:hypothetical protein